MLIGKVPSLSTQHLGIAPYPLLAYLSPLRHVDRALIMVAYADLGIRESLVPVLDLSPSQLQFILSTHPVWVRLMPRCGTVVNDVANEDYLTARIVIIDMLAEVQVIVKLKGQVKVTYYQYIRNRLYFMLFNVETSYSIKLRLVEYVVCT